MCAPNNSGSSSTQSSFLGKNMLQGRLQLAEFDMFKQHLSKRSQISFHDFSKFIPPKSVTTICFSPLLDQICDSRRSVFINLVPQISPFVTTGILKDNSILGLLLPFTCIILYSQFSNSLHKSIYINLSLIDFKTRLRSKRTT